MLEIYRKLSLCYLVLIQIGHNVNRRIFIVFVLA